MERRYIVTRPFTATRIDTGDIAEFEPTDQLWWDEEPLLDPVIFTLYDKFKFRVDDRITFTQSIEPSPAQPDNRKPPGASQP